MICYVCQRVYGSRTLFGSHMHLHGVYKESEVFCVEGKCALVETNRKQNGQHFHNLSSFFRHCERCHSKPNLMGGIALPENEIPRFNDNQFNNDLVQHDNSGFNDAHVGPRTRDNTQKEELSHEKRVEEFQKKLKFNILRIISQLYSVPTTVRKQIQKIVEFIQLLLNDSFADLKSVILNICNVTVFLGNDTKILIEEVFMGLENIFSDVNTEHKRLKLFEKQGTYIPPKEVTLAAEVASATKNNKLTLVGRPLYAYFIPLRHVFQRFLEQPQVMSKIIEYMNTLSSESCILSNYMQATQFMALKNDSKFFLATFLFSDEFECRNAIGSRSGLQKLTAFYVTLPFLPCEYRSVLENIFLVYLFHSADRKFLDPKKLYAPLIEEFTYLATTGINIKSDGFTGIVYFNLSQLTGDNLGLSAVASFVEGPMASFPCRICKIPRNRMITECKENPKLLRTRESYNEDVSLGDPKSTGINMASPWNEVPYFHVIENVSVDVLHDLLEGVCKYDLELILCHFLKNKYFDLDTLNNKIRFFNYGCDKKNKPPCISPAARSAVLVRMSASETLVFIIFFGLMVGEYIPENDSHWLLYKILRKILDLMLSPSVSKTQLAVLQSLIEDHHELYLSLSSDKILKNKFHNMLHYPSLIEKFGPLLHLWAMRGEARHRVGKLIVAAIACNINLTKSLSTRNQLMLHSYFFYNKGLKDRKECGKLTEVLVPELENFNSFKNDLPPQSENQIYFSASSVSFYGTKYKPEMVVVIDYDEDVPLFGIIKHILVRGEQILIICNMLETLDFNSHYHCFGVSYTNEYTCTSQNKLAHVFLTVIVCTSFDELYIPYKYGL